MSNHPLIQFATQPQLKTARGDHDFKVGDGVKVATKVREGDKERTQTFSGIVIQRKGGGIHATFTVRRISFGEGVERTFPVHSPNIEKIEVERTSQVMRARLFYLRDRQGKSATKVKEKRFDPTEHAAAVAAAAAAKLPHCWLPKRSTPALGGETATAPSPLAPPPPKAMKRSSLKCAPMLSTRCMPRSVRSSCTWLSRRSTSAFFSCSHRALSRLCASFRARSSVSSAPFSARRTSHALRKFDISGKTSSSTF